MSLRDWLNQPIVTGCGLCARLKSCLDNRLIDGWQRAHRMWSVRAALGTAIFWGAIEGLNSIWSAFQDHVSLHVLAGGGIVLGILSGLSRLISQPALHTEKSDNGSDQT